MRSGSSDENVIAVHVFENVSGCTKKVSRHPWRFCRRFWHPWRWIVHCQFLVGVVGSVGSGWKNSVSLLIALFASVPVIKKGVAGVGFFFSSLIEFSIATVSVSSLEVSGIGNFFGLE